MGGVLPLVPTNLDPTEREFLLVTKEYKTLCPCKKIQECRENSDKSRIFNVTTVCTVRTSNVKEMKPRIAIDVLRCCYVTVDPKMRPSENGICLTQHIMILLVNGSTMNNIDFPL
jgi:hypothetical protein